MTNMERVEYTTAQDLYFNYCLWQYRPVALAKNKLRSVNLLFQSFELGQMDDRAYQLVQAIRKAIGLFRTVFGIKWLGDRLTWEFYFYDYKRREREVSITGVLEAIQPFVQCDVHVNESLPYFMFSIDINQDMVSGDRDLDTIHMYIGNPGSTVSSGIAYALTSKGTALESLYSFFDAKRQLKDAAEKIYCSTYIDAAQMDIERILRPELRNCHTICVANKQRNDTVYFSGVNVGQLLAFLRMLDYPSEVIKYVEENRANLDHLLYDVGFDYVTDGEDLVILKSGYYGVF